MSLLYTGAEVELRARVQLRLMSPVTIATNQSRVSSIVSELHRLPMMPTAPYILRQRIASQGKTKVCIGGER